MHTRIIRKNPLSWVISLIIFLLVISTPHAKELRSRGFAGFQYRDVLDADVDSLNLSHSSGLYVRRVFPNTPAYRAGLNAGDVVLQYDDQKVVNGVHLASIMKDYYAGDEINLLYLRLFSPKLIRIPSFNLVALR